MIMIPTVVSVCLSCLSVCLSVCLSPLLLGDLNSVGCSRRSFLQESFSAWRPAETARVEEGIPFEPQRKRNAATTQSRAEVAQVEHQQPESSSAAAERVLLKQRDIAGLAHNMYASN
jgi:hypothetical protein